MNPFPLFRNAVAVSMALARLRFIARLDEIFSREVLAFLVGRELLSPEWAERILTWRHTGFNVHSRVRAKTKPEAERVGK